MTTSRGPSSAAPEVFGAGLLKSPEKYFRYLRKTLLAFSLLFVPHTAVEPVRLWHIVELGSDQLD